MKNTRNKWILPRTSLELDYLSKMFGIPPIVSQILYQRGFTNPIDALAYLDPTRYAPTPADQLPGLPSATEILLQAINRNYRILLLSGLDIDGYLATTILYSALTELGCNVNFDTFKGIKSLPGIHPDILGILTNGKFDLLIACNIGIHAPDVARICNDNKISSIYLGYGLDPGSIIDDCAIIKPELLPENHALRYLTGSCVVYKLLEKISTILNTSFQYQKHLDLISLGIVSENHPIVKETRYLLQLGLNCLRNTQRVGLQSLFQITDIAREQITEDHIRYIITPRLNSIIRKINDKKLIEFLTTDDHRSAQMVAHEIEGVYRKHKLVSDQVFASAQKIIKNNLDHINSPILFIEQSSWPISALGQASRRLTEYYHRPTFLLSIYKGSNAIGAAYSTPEINIIEILKNLRYISSLWGNSNEAKFELDPLLVPRLKKEISSQLKQLLHKSEDQYTNLLVIDAYLPLSEIATDTILDFERLAPFGRGNPSPVLMMENVEVKEYSVSGKYGQNLLLTICGDNGYTRQVLWRNANPECIPSGKFNLAYTIRNYSYRRKSQIQIIWLDHMLIDSSIEATSPVHKISVIDFREEEDPISILNQITKESQLVIWCESNNCPQKSCNRMEISQCSDLVIWTIPPSYEVLNSVLSQANPERVYLFSLVSNFDQPAPFIKRLLGLLKFFVRNQRGLISYSTLAALTAQREITVQIAMEWLIEHNLILCNPIDHNQYIIEFCIIAGRTTVSDYPPKLIKVLNETRSYRQYYRYAKKDSIINSRS
jgi:single-stranded-DNA-specific exonuclease